MAKQATEPSKVNNTDGRSRLSGEERRRSILKAAKRAFAETGDMNGTTIRMIAENGGISEGMIYRHFESKDQLFLEAVVEPLKEAVDKLVAATEIVDRDEPLTPERQFETMTAFYRQLISILNEMLPLLGLVLFGDPKVARKFYRNHLVVAMDRMADAWREIEGHYDGFEMESPEVSARAVMGIALMISIESRYGNGLDHEQTIALIGQRTLQGFFPIFKRGTRTRRSKTSPTAKVAT